MDRDTPVIGCVSCGHREPFLRLPLLCLSGPSGTGKSTVARLLTRRFEGRVVVLEQDVLWRAGMRDPTDDHRMFRSTWLRMAAMIHQSGRPVVLSGTVVPPELEPLPERVLFDTIHYLCLVCDPPVLRERLWGRPEWRQWSTARIDETVEFDEWLRSAATSLEPPMTIVDTTSARIESTADDVCAWVVDRAGVDAHAWGVSPTGPRVRSP